MFLSWATTGVALGGLFFRKEGSLLGPHPLSPLRPGPQPFDPPSLRERGNSVRPSFPLSAWRRGGQGVRTTRAGQGVTTTRDPRNCDPADSPNRAPGATLSGRPAGFTGSRSLSALEGD